MIKGPRPSGIWNITKNLLSSPLAHCQGFLRISLKFISNSLSTDRQTDISCHVTSMAEVIQSGKKKGTGWYLLTICPVVWKASSTIVSSWSDAAWWNTEKMFFQPDLMLAACEFTICATHLITISLIVGDLREHTHDSRKLQNQAEIFYITIIMCNYNGT